MADGTPILCIVGPSGSGKTTLMEGLIGELSKRGYRIATIKHTHHRMELDQREKDSWRHRQAGAKVSVLSSRGRVAVCSELERELTAEELRGRFIHDVDLILVEGYKSSRSPKIVVVGKGGWDASALGGSLTGIRAIVSDQRLDADVPVFRSADVTGIITFLEDKFLSGLQRGTE